MMLAFSSHRPMDAGFHVQNCSLRHEGNDQACKETALAAQSNLRRELYNQKKKNACGIEVLGIDAVAYLIEDILDPSGQHHPLQHQIRERPQGDDRPH